MKRGSVEIELKTGQRVSVPATLSDSGQLAFHRQVDKEGKEITGAKSRWTVTHVRTGRVIKHFRLSTHCRKLVKELDEYGFELAVGAGKTEKLDDLRIIVENLCEKLDLTRESS